LTRISDATSAGFGLFISSTEWNCGNFVIVLAIRVVVKPIVDFGIGREGGKKVIEVWFVVTTVSEVTSFWTKVIKWICLCNREDKEVNENGTKKEKQFWCCHSHCHCRTSLSLCDFYWVAVLSRIPYSFKHGTGIGWEISEWNGDFSVGLLSTCLISTQ